MMNSKYIFPALLLATLVGCNQAEKKTDETRDSIAVKSDTAVKIKDANTDIMYTHYVSLKDALVESKAADAQTSSQALADALGKINGCENTAKLASEIAASTDLAVQRTKFTALSSDIIALLKHADLNSGNIFVQYCPMANDNDGAYWLSSEKSIRNPYYGSEMLNCGEVTETLAAK